MSKHFLNKFLNKISSIVNNSIVKNYVPLFAPMGFSLYGLFNPTPAPAETNNPINHTRPNKNNKNNIIVASQKALGDSLVFLSEHKNSKFNVSELVKLTFLAYLNNSGVHKDLLKKSINEVLEDYKKTYPIINENVSKSFGNSLDDYVLNNMFTPHKDSTRTDTLKSIDIIPDVVDAGRLYSGAALTQLGGLKALHKVLHNPFDPKIIKKYVSNRDSVAKSVHNLDSALKNFEDRLDTQTLRFSKQGLESVKKDLNQISDYLNELLGQYSALSEFKTNNKPLPHNPSSKKITTNFAANYLNEVLPKLNAYNTVAQIHDAYNTVKTLQNILDKVEPVCHTNLFNVGVGAYLKDGKVVPYILVEKKINDNFGVEAIAGYGQNTEQKSSVIEINEGPFNKIETNYKTEETSRLGELIATYKFPFGIGNISSKIGFGIYYDLVTKQILGGNIKYFDSNGNLTGSETLPPGAKNSQTKYGPTVKAGVEIPYKLLNLNAGGKCDLPVNKNSNPSISIYAGFGVNF